MRELYSSCGKLLDQLYQICLLRAEKATATVHIYSSCFLTQNSCQVRQQNQHVEQTVCGLRKIFQKVGEGEVDSLIHWSVD